MSNENVARNETARQHTPGPWRVIPGSYYSDEPTGVVDSDGLTVAQVKYDGGEETADATLIAASPDLLEAAVNVVGWYFDQIYDGPPGPQDDEGGNGVESCIAELQEAIAKATGARR